MFKHNNFPCIIYSISITFYPSLHLLTSYTPCWISSLLSPSFRQHASSPHTLSYTLSPSLYQHASTPHTLSYTLFHSLPFSLSTRLYSLHILFQTLFISSYTHRCSPLSLFRILSLLFIILPHSPLMHALCTPSELFSSVYLKASTSCLLSSTLTLLCSMLSRSLLLYPHLLLAHSFPHSHFPMQFLFS